MSEMHENALCIRGSNEWGRHVGDQDSLRMYDEAAWRSRRRIDGPEDSARKAGPYRGSLYFSEIPARLNGQHAPVLLSMAAGYIYSQLCDASCDLIKTWIPYRYVRGKNHGKIKGKYRRWDMRLSAGGQEGVVEQLRQRVWTYERQRLDILLTRWDTECRRCAYVLEERESQPALHIVFSDKEALRRVRPRYFTDDCRALMRSSDELEKAVREETRLLAHHVEQQLSDIRTHYRNVTPIPKQYRTMRRPCSPPA